MSVHVWLMPPPVQPCAHSQVYWLTPLTHVESPPHVTPSHSSMSVQRPELTENSCPGAQEQFRPLYPVSQEQLPSDAAVPWLLQVVLR